MNHAKKILFIHQQSHIGGGQTYVNEVTKHLRKRGIKCDLIETNETLKLLRCVYTTRADAIIWSVYSKFPLLPYLFSSFYKKNNLLVIYGIWQLESRSLFWGKVTKKQVIKQKIREVYLLIRQYIFCFFSTQILHLSDYAQKLFLSTPLLGSINSKKQIIIFGGADKQLFKPTNEKTRFKIRESLGINNKDTILLMAGRIEKRKNYFHGLKILRELKSMNPRVNYFLYLILSYGKFNDFKYIDLMFKKASQLELGNYVRIISGIKKEEIAKYYQVADAFLMLSKELETFGLVTLEAISCGCPVFGYKACATPEIISSQKQQFLFPVDRIDKIARGINTYLNLPNEERKKIIAQIIKNSNRFTWEKTTEIILNNLERT